MFGLFKKNKISAAEDQFVTDVAIFSSHFQDYCSIINDQDRQIFGERAINNWDKKDPSEAHYSASDFFMDAFTGAIFELMSDGRMNVGQFTNIYREVTHFFDNYPKYNSDLVKFLMGKWKQYIHDAGGGPVIHY